MAHISQLLFQYLVLIFILYDIDLDKQNPILFVHAHVAIPFDKNVQFSKQITNDLQEWNDDNVMSTDSINKWLMQVKQALFINELMQLTLLRKSQAIILLQTVNWSVSEALEQHFSAQELTLRIKAVKPAKDNVINVFEEKLKKEHVNGENTLSAAQKMFKEYFYDIGKFGSKRDDYYSKIFGNGYDDFEMMLCFDDDVLETEIGMKKMHRKYFIKKINEFEQNSKVFKNWLLSIKMYDYYQSMAKEGIMTFDIFYKLFPKHFNGLIDVIGVNNKKDALFIWNNSPKHVRQKVQYQASDEEEEGQNNQRTAYI